ncbi:arrestin domain-containing protein C31A2.12-like [Aricia agestis]|uniref:arrestin domain-containing protein C31A2.12-like n=1 Tax=Aricia agestis TaxID=91739 RepID=UPI001C20412D|nr:arrestin domain-containing protein C31A2.12-like [Aricia agestis]
MVWDKCNIILHSASDSCFYTNNIITGSIILEFTSKRKVEKVDMRVQGSCEAQWSRFSPTIPYLKIYSDKYDVLSVAFDTFENINGRTVNPGVYTYQFNLFLQSDLPSTYEDSIAKVRYRVIVEGKSKTGFKLYNKVLPFTVKNYTDLNDASIDYKVPLIFEGKKSTCFGNFTLYIKTYRGFAPNQRLPIQVILENKKRIKVKLIEITLIQKIEYNVTEGFHNRDKRICSTMHKDIQSLKDEQCRLYLEMPPLVPSTVNETNPMVTVSYVLEAKVSFRYHTSLYYDIPVVISTVPVAHVNF